MISQKVFTVTPAELVQLAALQLVAIHKLPDGEFGANVSITTDGQSSELTDTTFTFTPNSGERPNAQEVTR